ncbi:MULTISPECIES: hypothetical protein [unclassified Halomonas]|uniref:hypothetical protein n=1 Tax=unclassified Halomonas TaxID=2609666 RepID=UPI002888C046|nr:MULTISPECIES: hypothetical protein [unclassified Halomonas]MDT0500480.1 hypothetical protein [Halomonas sp. PAR7]MDT0511624.1 hypothetical protein [Halomonas sp. LES1]MDT0590088.1 hypothetical protein [Halomonas sp. PAR8]
MPFTEAKEHAPGRLHRIFTDPYTAFGNMATERLLHLQVALAELVTRPLRQRTLLVRLIHGWENGECAPESLRHGDYRLGSLDELRALEAHHRETFEYQADDTGNPGELLARPLVKAIERAEQAGLAIDEETRHNPSRWPAFTDGLALYTLFKVYHRLIYGEDAPYRSIHLRLAEGEREVHEFHLEEGEFAVITPCGNTEGESLLMLHPSQLPSMLRLLENTRRAEEPAH